MAALLGYTTLFIFAWQGHVPIRLQAGDRPGIRRRLTRFQNTLRRMREARSGSVTSPPSPPMLIPLPSVTASAYPARFLSVTGLVATEERRQPCVRLHGPSRLRSPIRFQDQTREAAVHAVSLPVSPPTCPFGFRCWIGRQCYLRFRCGTRLPSVSALVSMEASMSSVTWLPSPPMNRHDPLRFQS